MTNTGPDPPLPVVLIVFRRPDLTARVLRVMRRAGVDSILVVADGPRDGVAADAVACAEVDALVAAIDWAEVDVLRSATNLGCDERVRSGLDWAFTRVERAIVLEDDVVPHPTFFEWVAETCAAYDDDPMVDMVSGQNHLARWGTNGAGHLLARRGGINGWATWRHAWFRHRATPVPTAGDTQHLLVDLDIDPLVAEYVGIQAGLLRNGALDVWDNRWTTSRVLAGTYCAIPEVNLVRNIGWEPRANWSHRTDDVRASIPVGRAPSSSGPAPVDHDFDRAMLLVELLASHRRPELSKRLAHADAVPSDPLTRLHLEPFRHHESAAIVRHLDCQGVRSPALDALLMCFSEVGAR